MFLRELSLTNFKNFESLELRLSEKINIFIGDNGTGKTNILDAIHYLSFCKSFINLSDRQNIRFGEDFFIVRGLFERLGEDEDIYCALQSGKRKSFRRNNVEYKRLSEHIGLIPLVYSCPYDAWLIHNGSEVRRKFVDNIISQFDHAYLHALIKYNRILENRNNTLKEYHSGCPLDRDLIAVWDKQLCDLGQQIYTARQSFTTDITDIFQRYYSLISDDNERVKLNYLSTLAENSMPTMLQANFDKDLIIGNTSVGIHKDDFDFLIDTYPIRRFGSQGQQKTFVIALKFAWFDFIKTKMNITPILLLDDIFDKLDKKRVSVITRLVSEQNFGQICITDTSNSRMPSILAELNIDNNCFFLNENMNVKHF